MELTFLFFNGRKNNVWSTNKFSIDMHTAVSVAFSVPSSMPFCAEYIFCWATLSKNPHFCGGDWVTNQPFHFSIFSSSFSFFIIFLGLHYLIMSNLIDRFFRLRSRKLCFLNMKHWGRYQNYSMHFIWKFISASNVSFSPIITSTKYWLSLFLFFCCCLIFNKKKLM